MTPPRVHYLAHPPADGLGDAALAYRDLLSRAGWDVRWTPLVWGPHGLEPQGAPDPGDDEVVVLHVLLEWLGRMLEHVPRGRRVGYVTWEADRLPADTVAALDQLDHVIVPSEFNRGVFERSGVRTPVSVVPHVLRRPRPEPVLLDGVPDDAFVFYLIATWSTRKCVPETVTAFLDEFDGDEAVALVVKTTSHDQMAVERRRRAGLGPDRSEETWWSLARLMAGRDAPPVLLIAGAVDDRVIDALHARGDVALAPSRSEGFGLVPYDAGMYANPAILTRFGAGPEIMPPAYPLLIDCDVVPTSSDEPDGWIQLADDQWWARPDFGHLRELMRWTFEHREHTRNLGREVRRHLRSTYRDEVILDALVAAVAPGPR